jgi:hypothetical protein
MSIGTAQAIVGGFELYALAGTLFAIVFLAIGIARVDPRTASAPKTLRLLIFPGLVVFWPLFARRWSTGAGAPEERTAHRDRARSAAADALARP